MALAGLAMLALGSSRRRAPAATTPTPTPPGGHRTTTPQAPPPAPLSGGSGRGRAQPLAYGRAKLPMLRDRWNNAALREATARFGNAYPNLIGIPVTALIASGSTSTGAYEHGGPPDYATGWYGVEWQWWQRAALDAETRHILGRQGPTTYLAFDADTDAQAFAGMRTYSRHLSAVAAALRAAGRVQLGNDAFGNSDPTWRYRLAVSAYSAGPGTVARTIAHALPDQAPNGATWRVLANAVAQLCPDCSRRVGPVGCCGRWKAADVVVRCDGRFEGGYLLAQAVAPSEMAFYSGRITTPDEIETARILTSRVNNIG